MQSRLILTYILVAFISFLSSTEIYAAPNLLLQCLAKEEDQFHKQKNLGAIYKLNQEFLNELATSNDIALKKNFIDEVCQNKLASASVALLRLLLIKESDIYDLSLSEVDPTMRPFKMGYINEFQKQVPRIFIQFLSSLQAEMPTSDCLTKQIPELSIFLERLKYLEEEMSSHEIIKDKTRIERIFTKLKNLKAMKANCEKEANKIKKKLQADMKKKESPNP